MAYPFPNIGEYVKHIHREHNQEADHMANLGPERFLKVTVEDYGSLETWTEAKTVRQQWVRRCGGRFTVSAIVGKTMQ